VPIYSAHLSTVSRARGQSATAAAAYRGAELVHDHRTGEPHDYRRKRGVLASGVVGWNGDRESLWNAAEAAEKRKNSMVAREWRVATPHELDNATALRLLHRFAQDLRDRYDIAASYDLHDAPEGGDERNRHGHLLWTTRAVDPETGTFGDKVRRLDVKPTSSQEVEWMRARWSEICNQALAEHGIDERLDHRSYERQGLDLAPMIHEGPTVTALRRRGVETEISARNDAILAGRARAFELTRLQQQTLDEIKQLKHQIRITHERALEARQKADAEAQKRADQAHKEEQQRRASGKIIGKTGEPLAHWTQHGARSSQLQDDGSIKARFDDAHIIDRGTFMEHHGDVTAQTAAAIAAAAADKGWTSVRLTGDDAYKIAVARELAKYDIQIENPGIVVAGAYNDARRDLAPPASAPPEPTPRPAQTPAQTPAARVASLRRELDQVRRALSENNQTHKQYTDLINKLRQQKEDAKTPVNDDLHIMMLDRNIAGHKKRIEKREENLAAYHNLPWLKRMKYKNDYDTQNAQLKTWKTELAEFEQRRDTRAAELTDRKSLVPQNVDHEINTARDKSTDLLAANQDLRTRAIAIEREIQRLTPAGARPSPAPASAPAPAPASSPDLPSYTSGIPGPSGELIAVASWDTGAGDARAPDVKKRLIAREAYDALERGETVVIDGVETHYSPTPSPGM
jgi:hypothetical protein